MSSHIQMTVYTVVEEGGFWKKTSHEEMMSLSGGTIQTRPSEGHGMCVLPLGQVDSEVGSQQYGRDRPMLYSYFLKPFHF